MHTTVLGGISITQRLWATGLWSAISSQPQIWLIQNQRLWAHGQVAYPQASASSSRNGAHQSPRKLSMGNKLPLAIFPRSLGLTTGSRPWPGLWDLGFRSSSQLPTSCPPRACSKPRASRLALCCHVSYSLASRRCRPSSLPLRVPWDGGGRERTLRVPLKQRASSADPNVHAS